MFHGSIVALVTPMDERGGVDFSALKKLVSFHLDQSTDGIVVAGSTGESATMTVEEFRTALSAVVSQVDGRVPVLAGTGSASTAVVIERTEMAAEAGADGALVVAPYYVRPMQSGLVAHYATIARSARIPLVLYNVPSRTATDLLPVSVAELAQHDRIVAIKEAVPDPGRVRELRERCGDAIDVLSGDDASCLAAMREGAVGVVSVAANVVPRQMRELCRHARRADWESAARIDAVLNELYRALGVESNPIPVKWMLYRMGLIGQGIRLPLLPLAEQHRAAVEALLESHGLGA